MKELTMNEVKSVNGGVSQGTAIGGNLSIIAIGVGIIAAPITAPAWFIGGMIAISVSLTASYISES